MSPAVQRVHSALERCGCNPKPSGNGYRFRCPAHNDRNPSASLSEGEDGRAIMCCQVGCPTEKIVEEIGLKMADLFVDEPKTERRIVATYDYTDEAGKLLYQAVRFDPKGFMQRRPGGTDGWTWKLGDVRRVLYQLPGLIVATAAKWTIYICEGEKDVDAINGLESGSEFFATCNPMGAGKWRPEYSETLKGANIVIIADKDEAGRKHALDVRAALKGVAASVEIKQSKGEKNKDAADHLAAGHGLEDFVPMAEPGATDETPKVREASFIDLYDLVTKPQEPIPWQVEGYMSRRESVTLGGEWGSGKSLTALDLAIALTTGMPWMDHVPIIGGPYCVIYLDEENGRALAERRIRQLLMGRELHPDVIRHVPLFYTTRNGIKLSDPSWYDWLKRQIDEREATHLFLDALIRFSRIDENAASENAAFFGDCIQPLMNEYDLSVLAVDHMGKPSKERTDPGHRLRGSSEKPAATDELICMDGTRGQDTRTLSHEKTRWNKYQPVLLTTCTESDDEQRCWITARDEKPETTDQIARQIQASGFRGVLRADLMTALGENAARTVSRAIKTLREEHTIRSKTEGHKVRFWASATAPEDAK